MTAVAWVSSCFTHSGYTCCCAAMSLRRCAHTWECDKMNVYTPTIGDVRVVTHAHPCDRIFACLPLALGGETTPLHCAGALFSTCACQISHGSHASHTHVQDDARSQRYACTLDPCSEFIELKVWPLCKLARAYGSCIRKQRCPSRDQAVELSWMKSLCGIRVCTSAAHCTHTYLTS